MRYLSIAVIALALLLCAQSTRAHQMTTAYLEITEQSDATYDLLWKRSMRTELEPSFSGFCEAISDRAESRQSKLEVDYAWTMQCDQSLIGQRLTIKNLQNTITIVLVRITYANGNVVTMRLTPSSPSGIIPAAPSWTNVVKTYTFLGVEHILEGIDHLLFVLSLLLIIRGAAMLFKAITAFTVAHSITLAMASLGFVNVPGPPVEAIIALSIVFVASEILHRDHRAPGLAERSPWLVAASFGLLHGFGFAGALADIGLPEGDIPLALFTFNLGVEIGQLIFVVIVMTIGWVGAKLWKWPTWSRQAMAYGIGGIAAYWVLDRVGGFFG